VRSCRRWLARSAFVALLLAVALPMAALRAGAGPPVAYEGPSWMARLAMVGDSMTWTSVDTFKPALRANWWRPAIFSFPGVRTETMRDQVRAMAADRPDAFVVQLGGLDTLDIISGARSWAFEQAQLAGTIADIQGAGVPCVVWVGPNQAFDGGPIDAWSTAINDQIRYDLAARGAGVFSDWTTVSAGHPEYFVADGSHLTDVGKQGYIAMINASLRNCTSNPRGNLDVAAAGIGVRVQGWAYDTDSSGPIPVHVYIDGTFQGVLTANSSRPDVAAAFPGVSANHGFEGSFVLGAGPHQVCAYGINVGPFGFTNPALGCRSVTIDGSPTGYVDSATGAAGSARVRGWTIDADVTWGIDVHVYVDGVFRTAANAGGARPDLGSLFPAYGAGHGFDTTVGGLGSGSHQLCVYGINNVFTAGQNRQLGCRSVAVS
jgi:hypothetical protein